MKKCFLLILPLFLLTVFLFGLTPVSAQNFGLEVTGAKAGYNKTDTPESITTLVINSALALVYIAFFILVLYAGIRWMTAQGNEEHVTKAKNILEAAIIGVVVISAAYAITNFILGKVGAGEQTNIPKENEVVGCVVDSDCTVGVCDRATGECVSLESAPKGCCFVRGGVCGQTTQNECNVGGGCTWFPDTDCGQPQCNKCLGD